MMMMWLFVLQQFIYAVYFILRETLIDVIQREDYKLQRLATRLGLHHIHSGKFIDGCYIILHRENLQPLQYKKQEKSFITGSIIHANECFGVVDFVVPSS